MIRLICHLTGSCFFSVLLVKELEQPLLLSETPASICANLLVLSERVPWAGGAEAAHWGRTGSGGWGVVLISALMGM